MAAVENDMINNENSRIDIHADDYALTVNTSAQMIELMNAGVLDSISIVPNSDCYDTCMNMLKEAIPSLPFLPLMSVHLNLVEGYILSAHDRSLMSSTWKSLFFDSFRMINRKKIKQKLESEISEQIKVCSGSIRECMKIAEENGIRCAQKGIRIDSHQHSHMIPIVWSALMDCLNQEGLDVEYIRNSREPLGPFISMRHLWKTYRFVNLVKNRILYVLSAKCDRYDKKAGLEPMYLWGLVMSGRMDVKRIRRLFPHLKKRAEEDGRRLEILFHPGRMKESEMWPGIPESSAYDFYLSVNRDLEKEGAKRAKDMKLDSDKR